MIALLRMRNFALLWFGGLISYIGDWVLSVALPVYVFTLTRSVLATGLMFMISIVPNILLGSVAGVFVDRWDRRWAHIISNALRGPLLLLLLIVQSPDQLWFVYVTAFVVRCIGQLTVPAENALLPKLVGEEHLVKANALNTLNDNLARLIGPAVGGVIFAAFGFGSAVIVDSASFIIAAVMVYLIDAPPSVTRATHERGEEEEQARGGVVRQWLDGLRVVKRSRAVTALFALLGFNAFAEGIIGVLIVIYVQTSLRGGAMEFGWLLAAQAVGGFLGGLFVGRLSEIVKPQQLVWLGFALLGGIDILIFNIPNLSIDIVLMIVVGVPVVALQAGVMTLFQRNVSDAYRGRVFGAYGATYSLLLMLSTGFTSLFGSAIGVVLMLTAAGTLDVLAGVAAFLLLPEKAHEGDVKSNSGVQTSGLAQNTSVD